MAASPFPTSTVQTSTDRTSTDQTSTDRTSTDQTSTDQTGASRPSGRIAISGIAGFGHHGVFDFEREHGQRFVVDVACRLDLDTAAASDDVGDTVDYGSLAAAVKADIEGEPVNLIETLAARVAATCLADPRVTTVDVTVHKPDAPMPVETDDVSVTLTRSRQ